MFADSVHFFHEVWKTTQHTQPGSCWSIYWLTQRNWMGWVGLRFCEFNRCAKLKWNLEFCACISPSLYQSSEDGTVAAAVSNWAMTSRLRIYHQIWISFKSLNLHDTIWHDMTRYDTAYLNLVGVMLLGSVCLSKTEIETFAAKRSTKDALLSYEAVPQTKTPNTSVASGRIEWHCRTIRTQRWKWWRLKTASQKYGSWRWDRLLHGIRIFQILLAPFGSCWSLYVGFLIYRKLSSFW